MTSAVEPVRCPDHGRVGLVTATSGQRTVLVVYEHGLDVTGADAGGLQSGDLAVGITVDQETELSVAQVADSVEGGAHVGRTRQVPGWRRVPRGGAAPAATREREGWGVGAWCRGSVERADRRRLRPYHRPGWSLTAPQAQ